MKKQLLKIVLTLFLISGMYNVSNGQGHWLATVSGTVSIFTNEYRGNHLAIDKDGNTFTTGTYGSSGTAANRWTAAWSHGQTTESGTAAFTLTNAGTSSGRHNSFIAKTDKDGVFEWMLGIGSTVAASKDTTTTNSIAVDTVNNTVFVGGYFSGKIDYFSDLLFTGPAIADAGADDGLVMALSNSGVYKWHKVFSNTTSSNERVRGVTTDTLGNVIVIGIYDSKLKINGIEVVSVAAKGNNDMFVAKFDKDGTLLFIKTIGGDATHLTTILDDIWGLATDRDNSIYVAGSVGFGTVGAPKEVYVDGNQLLPQGLGTNSFLAKFNSAGDYQWAKVVSSDVGHTQIAHSIAVDNETDVEDRSVYITGYTSTSTSTVEINFAGHILTPTNTSTSPYVAKFSAQTGDGIWANIFDAGATCYGYVVSVNPNKEVYVGGYAQTTINFGDGNISAKGSDGFIAKLNPVTGTVLDKKMIFTTGSDTGADRVCGLVATNTAIYANGIAAGAGAAVPYTTTNFAGTGADYHYRGGSWNAFILKWNSTTLPVSLTEFKGSKTSLGNLLSWKTLSETDNQYFELERSSDGINFSSIKRIDGAGTSTEKLSYNYLDTHPLPGVNYYRLKQIDKNGAFSYSEDIVAVNSELVAKGLVVYPNPGFGVVNIQLTSLSVDTEINVYNQAGKLVKSYTGISNNTHVVDISKQPIGVYYIQVIEKGKSKLSKYIKQ